MKSKGLSNRYSFLTLGAVGLASTLVTVGACTPGSTGSAGPAPLAPEIVRDFLAFPDGIAVLPGDLDGTPGELIYNTEGNRLNRYDIDSIDEASLEEDTLIVSYNDNSSVGRDVNGGICVSPNGNLIMGEDTGQSNDPPILAGWGLFDIAGTQIGKNTPTADTGKPEPHGCVFNSDGNLFTSEVGDQAIGSSNGQLIMWFPPFTDYPGAPGTYPNSGISTNFCIIADDIGTAGQIAIDAAGRVYVTSAGSGKVLRFSPPFPTGPGASQGCGGATSKGGSPTANPVAREVFIDNFLKSLTPTGIVQSPVTGNWYVSSVFTGSIHEYGPDGIWLQTILAGGGLNDPIPRLTGHPQNLALDSNGTLYYTDLQLTGTLPDVGPGPDGKVWRIRFAP